MNLIELMECKLVDRDSYNSCLWGDEIRLGRLELEDFDL